MRFESVTMYATYEPLSTGQSRGAKKKNMFIELGQNGASLQAHVHSHSWLQRCLLTVFVCIWISKSYRRETLPYVIIHYDKKLNK